MKTIKTETERPVADAALAITNCFDFVESKLLPVGGDIKVNKVRCCLHKSLKSVLNTG